MPGQAIAHYATLGKVSEGRLGVVYKARDTDLDPFVALNREKVATSVIARPDGFYRAEESALFARKGTDQQIPHFVRNDPEKHHQAARTSS